MSKTVISNTRIILSRGDCIWVQESVDEVKKLIESSKDGDFITLTQSAPNKPVYVLRNYIAYFLAN